MALKHKGEFQVEDGFGLPKKTTTERLAYTPPEDGYQVFDTDLGRVATWTLASGWSLLGLLGDVDDDKIDILNGFASTSLSLQTSTGDAAVKFLAATAQGLDNYIIEPTFYGRQTDVLLDNSPRTLRSTGTQTWSTGVARLDTVQTSGKWYWETMTGSTANSSGGTGYGVTANASALIENSGADASSWGVMSWTGSIVHNDNVTATTTAFTGPNIRLRHKLDLDNGIYEVAVGSGNYVVVDNSLPTGNYLPTVSVWGSSVAVLFLRENNHDFERPEGYTPWMPAYISETDVVKIESELTNGDLCFVNTSGNTEFALKDGEMAANAPILGIESDDPTSLVTRAFVDRYLSNFSASDWNTSNGVSTITFSHGLSFVTGETVFDIQVTELSNGNYKAVSLEHTTDETTGVITLRTIGAPFDGRIRISR